MIIAPDVLPPRSAARTPPPNYSHVQKNYRNVYDPSVGNMHAKNADGSWTDWHGATAEGQGCVESNPYQQGWFVPQDVPGLMNLMGTNYF